MIESTQAYKEAIVGTTRHIVLKVIVDITDPDIVYTDVNSSAEANVSKNEQIHDKVFTDPDRYATLELNRWVLDGGSNIYPAPVSSNQGFIGGVLSNDQAQLNSEYVEITFQNVDILQSCSLYFTNNLYDGYPVDFKVEIMQAGTSYFEKTFIGNTDTSVVIMGFTVYNPDAIRLTVTKWSLPYRRIRVIEMIPGIYEEWTEKDLSSFSVNQQGDVSCLSLPYGSCDMTIDNLDRVFEYRNKSGIFQSLEERQRIQTQIGVVLPDGTVEYKPVGTFYQYSEGWKTSKNSMLISWSLVDIIGLLANREYNPPDILPTTLDGWIKSIVSQLGVNFENQYAVDPNYGSIALTTTKEAISDMTCGDLLLYLCMVTATWPRADAETGKLTVEPVWDAGNKITLDNMSEYPEISANQDIAAIFFTINGEKLVISGNSTSADTTSSIENPFITDSEKAYTAARVILYNYGGNKYSLVGRGDPSCEIGDVNTIWVDKSSAVVARVIQQEFSMTSGVLKNCKMTLIQPDGSFMYENRAVITESGQWTAPSGVSKLRVILVGGGAGGENGTDGTWTEAGIDGTDGQGGLVWADTININDAQLFNVTIGAGGAIGQPGNPTVFGEYSSANGQNFDPNFTDIASGNAYGRDGVTLPIANSGDGGKGGKGGVKGNYHTETTQNPDGSSSSHTVIDNYPGEGEPGVPGASGCIIVYWDKE